MIDSSGYTYCHEHLHIDLSEQKKNIDCRLDQYSLLCDEMRELQHHGVRNIVEVTNFFMGRNPHFIENLMRDTEINVLLSTGYYIEGFFPPELYQMSVSDIAANMIKEIEVGIDDTSLKASVIGEIGSSENGFSETEKNVFRAAAATQSETGKPISTHQSMSTMGRAQIELLKSSGASLEKVTIGHCDLRDNLDDILWMLDQGCYVQFDTIGKNNYYPDTHRAQALQRLCERGYEAQLMLSMDITRRSHLKGNGGLGFSYLMDQFVPLLKSYGVSDQQIEMMLKENPVRLFG